MRKTLLFSILILSMGACNKDKYTTAPQLKFESVNTTILGRNQELIFTLSFTDAEGDIQNTLTVLKVVKRCPANADSGFSQPYTVPNFPSGKNQAGELIVTFNYNDVSPKCFPKNDTALFKFVLADKANHLSDTAVSKPIIILN